MLPPCEVRRPGRHDRTARESDDAGDKAREIFVVPSLRLMEDLTPAWKEKVPLSLSSSTTTRSLGLWLSSSLIYHLSWPGKEVTG